MDNGNSRIGGLAETEATQKYFNIAVTYRERKKLKQPSPANVRLRDAYRLARANASGVNSDSGGSRQQTRARNR